jgi:hypothetical protein
MDETMLIILYCFVDEFINTVMNILWGKWFWNTGKARGGQKMLFLKRLEKPEGTYFIDSTALSVCENLYISTHRVTKGYASRGKTGRGWFFDTAIHRILHCFPGGVSKGLKLEFRPGK